MKKLVCAFLLCASSVGYAGVDEGLAAYEKSDYAVAIIEFEQAAEQGDAYAQYNSGHMYYHGGKA